jgi:hypothetical protein
LQSPERNNEKESFYAKTISIFDNIYTFSRSQEHTMKSLNLKDKQLSRIIDTLSSCKFSFIKSKLESLDLILSILGSQIKILDKIDSKYIKSAVTQLKLIK